jgi:transcriptional regulator with XRE-family HTH domain
MSLANNIKHLRESKGLQQKQVAIDIGLGISHYNKIENGQREASVEVLDKLAKLYGISIDAVVHMEGEVPKEIVIEDKTTSEQMRLIQELDEKDKSIILSIIDTMLTKKKFKDFFQKNVAAL